MTVLKQAKFISNKGENKIDVSKDEGVGYDNDLGGRMRRYGN